MANTRVLNSSKALMQKPTMSLSVSQTSSTGSGSNLPTSTSASVAPASAAGAPRTIRQSSYAQSYLTAATASQSSNSNPVMRSAVSRSVAGPAVYANVAGSTDPVAAASARARMQPSGMHLSLLRAQ